MFLASIHFHLCFDRDVARKRSLVNNDHDYAEQDQAGSENDINCGVVRRK